MAIADLEIHYLVVQDEFGNISEILKLSFELNVVEEEYFEKLGSEQRRVLKNIKYFEKHKLLPICFCPNRCTLKIGDPSVFIDDFQLSSEVSIEKNPNDCRHCYKFRLGRMSGRINPNPLFRCPPIGQSDKKG